MKRRNKALTVIISICPGAGQMFQGFMNSGLLFLGAFFGIIFFGALFDLHIIYLALPVVWCYSFFDSLNKMNHSDEEFYKLKDTIPFKSDLFKNSSLTKIAAIILIAAGAFSFWSEIYNRIWRIIYDTSHTYSDFTYFAVDILGALPKIAISITVIIVGICLIRKKKKEINKNDSTDN